MDFFKKKYFQSVLFFCLAGIQESSAKPILPAEVMGRDLLIPGLGWAGHVGISTAYMSSPKEMSNNANLVIEVLNELPVGQINTINNFKSRSKYWGSKYGVADRGALGFSVLLEANRQRWWCPKYTHDTNYHIGSGNLATGQANECGVWRCDTYVWWAFFSQGRDTMPGRVWLPRTLFNNFPYFNDERYAAVQPSIDAYTSIHKSLDQVTAEELNEITFEEFQMIMDAPLTNYVSTPYSLQMQMAENPILNDIKRGVMIDRLIANDNEPQLVKKLLNLFNHTDRIEVKNKIAQDLMLYNQRHQKDPSYQKEDQALLKTFFARLLNSEELNPKLADDVIRGYIDTHSPEEILKNRNKIDKWLPITGHHASIMLKYSLVHKSTELEKIYIKSIIKELREANNSDLDSYFFGPLSIGYENSGSDFLEPESKKIVIEYLRDVGYKYSDQGIESNSKDTHRITTAPYYFELKKNMGFK
jgi:hypothetical protein